MKERVLVSGAAGYLGAVLCEHLLDGGYEVTALDSIQYGQQSLFHLCANPRLSFVRGDARDETLMAELLAKADVVIPLAALVGAPACDRDPWTAQSVNLGAIQLINRLRSADQLVVYPNTNSGYGATRAEEACTEDTPLSPISLYGRTKVQAELELLQRSPTITLRLATVFGMSPRMRLDLLVNHFVYAAVTDGYLVLFEKHFKRNYVHVRDVADCFVHCLRERDRMAGRPYNLGLDSANLSKEELALKIREHVPSFRIEAADVGRDPDQRNYVVSSQRLRNAGFEARRSLDEGIDELLKGYAMMARSPYKNV